ncbi:MAG: CDP-2,3-bis-(O-geranylgeranyl)-sn-glycerol synthase [Methanosarcinales archaeon]
MLILSELQVYPLIITSLWLMLPAYFPNPFAVVVGGGTPIDFGKNFIDGKRILGDGKTWRGLFGGGACGILIGLLQIYLAQQVANLISLEELPSFPIVVLFTLSFGALIGDIIMSFVKRRLGLKRGAPLPIIDQLDFVFGAFALTYVFAPNWFISNFTFWIIITILIVTPVLHRITNIIGYILKLKEVPW